MLKILICNLLTTKCIYCITNWIWYSLIIQFKDKEKILRTIRERWRHFKSDLTSKWTVAHGKEGEDDKVSEKYEISKKKWTQFCHSRKDPSCEVSWFSLFLNLHIYVLLSTRPVIVMCYYHNMFKRRCRPFKNKTLSLTCCLVGVMIL